MLSLLWKILPHDYKWSVAIKKTSYTVAKLGVAAIVATSVGKKISPASIQAFEEVVGLLVAGGLTLVHDWAQVKFPKQKWL